MWSEDIFNLGKIISIDHHQIMLLRAAGEKSGGHCHTYNPTTNSFADEGFYAMLGKYVAQHKSGEGGHLFEQGNVTD